MLITEAYRKELQKMHKKDADWGTGPRGNTIRICNFLYTNNVKRILDYGCGKGELLGWFLPIQVANYDPAISQWSADPEPQDYLLCTDVLEHVEPQCIEAVIEHLVSKFNKKALLSIALQKSKKILKDGRNAHLLIRTPHWWIELLQRFCFIEHIEFAQDVSAQDDILITLKK
tara:strand:+ start:237 stop:755 length:519 start_codon:yes stop_codon:yes gene_type:complete